MNFDRRYVLWALCYAVAGMGLGIFMSASHDHTLHVAHAHILLVGFVVSLIYGVIHKLWLASSTGGVALAQFIIHQAGAFLISVGLVLFYGQFVAIERIEPVLVVGSLSVLAGAILMLYMAIRSPATLR